MKVKYLAPRDHKRKVYQRTNPRVFLDEMTQDGAEVRVCVREGCALQYSPSNRINHRLQLERNLASFSCLRQALQGSQASPESVL